MANLFAKKSLEKAVTKSIDKRKKDEEKKVKQVEINRREALVKTMSAPTALNLRQSRENYETASRITDRAQQDISNFLQSRGINPNTQAFDKRDTILTPSNRNAFNPSQILEKKVQKRQDVMNTEEGQRLSNELRLAKNTRNIEEYNYNLQKVQRDKTKFGDRTLGSFIRGVQGLFDNMGDSYIVTDDKGRDEKLASYATLKQQKVDSESNLPQRLVSATFNNLGKVLGAGAIDTVTLGVGGKTIYWGDTFLDSYNENKNNGYDDGSSLSSALLTTMLGAVIDKTLGSAAVSVMGDMDATGLEDVISKALTSKGMSSNVAKYLSSMSSEGISEFVEEYADAFINKMILDKSSDPKDYLKLIVETLPAALESGVVGGLSGGLGEFNKSVTNKISTNQKIKQLNKYLNYLETIKPDTPEAAMSKENMINDVRNQINELQTTVIENKKVEKPTDKQMEETALKALEERKNKKIEETAPNTTEQVETKPQPQEKVISSEQNNKESESTYTKAKNIQQEKGYTVYYSIPSDDIIEKGTKRASDISQEELDSGKIDLITYNTDDTRNVYEFDNKTELNKYIKSIGGYSAFEGKYTIMSNTKEGEFYYTRDKSSQGGWIWRDANNNLVKGWMSKSKIKETRETAKTNYNIPEAKNADKIVAKITENSTPKQKQQVEKVLSEPSKNKQTTKLDDGTIFINPSEKSREGGIESVPKYINDSVTKKEFNEIQIDNKKRRQGYQSLYNMYENQGNNEMANYIKKQMDEDLYTVEHCSYEVFQEQMKLLEDPENYYKKYNNEMMSLDKMTANDLKYFQYKQIALMQHYGDYESPDYNPTIANELAVPFAQEGTVTAQNLVARQQMYKNDPNYIPIRTQQTLNSMFRDEAKKHKGDADWLNKNDPMKNPNSPYKLSDTQFATISYYANEMANIENQNSTEYLTAYAQLHNYIQDIFGDMKLTSKMKSLTLTNVLASTRIWTQNIKGNLVNLAQFNGIDKLVATTVDKITSSKSGIRTTGMSFEGDVVQGGKAFKQGISDSFYELKNDVSLSKFHSKYTNELSNNMSDLGKKGFGKTFNDKTLVGRALNKYQNFVNFALDIGDRPFANMYYEQSIYNQRMLQAQLDAKKAKTNVIYNVNQNTENGTYRVRYFDDNGKKVTTIINEKQYNDFSKKAKIEEITEQMCKIAEKEALENTYQDDNRITRAALKMKDSLNEVFHVGEFGFGDMILKFTRTGSNMAKALYEHSPIAAYKVTKDIRTLNRNIKSGTVTPELQHQVSREIGKLLGGSITMAIVGALDWAGILKIEGEHDDKKGDKFKEATKGSQEFSIALPGENYRYKISNDSTIGSLARLGKTAEELIKETDDALDVLFGMTNPFINALIDNSFMSTVLDLGSSYSSPIDNLSKKIAAQPSNLIPSMMKDISYTLDNYTERNTYDKNLGQYMINQIINKTPWRGADFEKDTPIGKIKGLSPKMTAWGDVKTVGGDIIASRWNNWLTGDTLSKVKDDYISNEVARVYAETNNTKAIPNLNTYTDFSYNGKKYELNEKQKTKYMTTYGKKAYQAVRDLMNTNQYNNSNDEQKEKLLEQAYKYAKEKATEEYLNNKGIKYYNFNKKDNKYTEYKKPVFEEIIENDISIEEAQYKRKYNNSYKLKTSITSLENYQVIAKDIKEIKQAYKNENYKTRKYAIQTYINELEGLTSIQKAMLSKLENSKSDYTSYDNKILNYIKSLNLSDEEYQYMYKELGLGGYWSMYYKTKKKR